LTREVVSSTSPFGSSVADFRIYSAPDDEIGGFVEGRNIESFNTSKRRSNSLIRLYMQKSEIMAGEPTITLATREGRVQFAFSHLLSHWNQS
jgi:hypothetical protein